MQLSGKRSMLSEEPVVGRYLLSGCILAFVCFFFFFCISGTKFSLFTGVKAWRIGVFLLRSRNCCPAVASAGRQPVVLRGLMWRQQAQGRSSLRIRSAPPRICRCQNSCSTMMCSFSTFSFSFFFFYFNNLASLACIRSSCLLPVWQDGAILVFLPGWDGISSLNDLLMAQQMFRSGIHEGCAHAARRH